LEEHFDNLELLAQSAGSSACARGLNGEMERRRATFVELGVNSGARFEQLANGRWTPRAHRTMQGRRTATIDMLEFCPVLNQEHDEFCLLLWVPRPARHWSGIARVMQRSRTAAILCVRIRSALEKKLRGCYSQGCCRQV
jgi:hypothetical protein